MDIAIETAVTEHVKSIAAICSFGWKQTVEGKLSEKYRNKHAEEWYNHERVKADIEQGSYTHVAIVNSKVAGVIGGAITESRVSQVFVLYVEEKYRYKGIGRHLLNILTEEHKKAGATEQWVSVQDGNQRGIPFYEARGFRKQEKKSGVTDTGEPFVNLRYSRSL
ncbi:ribosomal-protein-alanine N-acetyltransferase [Oceanobacillus oncorhynchi]|uniref:Ribosomal-protein-alanine N-acetyltransferase n=1 Tax=Oceanobacillus oncorhynchi TaxID=545501 RepID=A0A0A1MXR9_9BACI|nr:GNAT family N-acetyltransferase [Oceanobacillus oncorhynchi]CEI83601.1 ribosomal-protein-alanine N-acetyltransferase [Oceanobacillus oncorhynchi]